MIGLKCMYHTLDGISSLRFGVSFLFWSMCHALRSSLQYEYFGRVQRGRRKMKSKFEPELYSNRKF